jgi:ubiquinone/menaquinone biosynthesis C-methylase UbiE
MLAIAKERAASLGLKNIIEFKEIDAEQILDLVLSSSSSSSNYSNFDAILCRWGLM